MKLLNTAIKAFSLLSIAVITSCSTTNKIAALKPEPDNSAAIAFENATSFISLPVKIKLKDIENQTNKLLQGLIYEDSNIEDDDIQMKVWKQADIKISEENNQIKTVLPLKIKLFYRYGTMGLYDTREINMNGLVTLISDVGLTNWKLSTNTTLKSLDWKESPTITIAGKNLPITYVINPAIRIFKSKLENNLDEAIKKSMDFKPNVLDALETICTPFQMSDTYDSWLRIVPEELYTTEAKLQKDLISLQMGLKCSMETIVGQQPQSKIDKNSIALKPVLKMPEKITANIAAISTYEDASRIMTKNFQGQEFGSGKKKIKVEKVAIWQKNNKMIIGLDLTGSITGTIYLSGFPQYNESTKEIYFDQLDYVLDTKNKLIKTANWLASGIILKKIESSCRYSIQPNLEEGRKNIMTYLKNYSPMPGVFVNGDVENIAFKKIQLTNKAIVAFITINGKVNISIDGLK
ncbi:DUF4403 family protein [Flavobacterium sp. NST-5]|uniref:DUF4403 family protein n=2 Tax=Flavobacterium ichthyis TaxID=2698827 RepID=A0ABW9Z9H4_9FLAO|nr:DUF4403 family protein [Flavobacterium ichthyis]